MTTRKLGDMAVL